MKTREELTRDRQDEWCDKPPKKNKKRRFIVIGSIAFVLIVVTGTLYTPRIHGVVIDAATNQPVKGAWVRATADMSTNTIGGTVHGTTSLARPHTRSDDEGRFTIPFRFFIKPPPPLGFGTSIDDLDLEAHTVDGRGAELKFKKGLFIPWWRLTVRITPLNWSQSREAHYLGDLSAYCLFGRFNVERPIDKGCDTWELDYAIARHERYFDLFPTPKTIPEESSYSGTLYRLASLYERGGRYVDAIGALIRVRDFNRSRGVTKREERYKRKINELKTKIGQ